MRTLIITGVYKNAKGGGIQYTVDIFGQTKEHPLCVFVKHFTITLSNYDQLCEYCKKEYCRYFKTDDYNIITMPHLHSAEWWARANVKDSELHTTQPTTT